MIAHASIDENGNISGGTAGDQNRKEVCIRTFYTNNWSDYIHIDNDAVRIAFGNNMVVCANNDNIGYNQHRRNTLLTKAEAVKFQFEKIKEPCECDCSSLVTIALLGAIYSVLGKDVYQKAKAIMVVGNNCATTSTLLARMQKLMLILKHRTSPAYVSSKQYAVFGDIYLRKGRHVVVYVDNGKTMGIAGADTSTEYYPAYNGVTNSIVMALIAIGVNSSKANRTEIAKANGITNYTGTAKQNLTMLSLLKQGKLKKRD